MSVWEFSDNVILHAHQLTAWETIVFLCILYMDELSNALNYAKVWIHGECDYNPANHLMYADVLIAVTVYAQHTLVNCCNRFACDNGVMYNNSKRCTCFQAKGI